MRTGHHILCLWLFVLWVPLHDERKHVVRMPKNIKEFDLRTKDITIKVSCKLKMIIFEGALVIKQYA